MNKILFFILSGMATHFIIGWLRFFVFNFLSTKMSRDAKNLTKISDKPIIGVFGDSVAQGVGVSCVENSLAGLFGRYIPSSTIINKSFHGFSVKSTMQSLIDEEYFDLLVICCGGMNILYLKSIKSIRKDLRELFVVANQKSKKVIFITPFNIGWAKAFPWYLRVIYSIKSKQVREMIQLETADFPNFIILDNFLTSPAERALLYKHGSAKDKIHINDYGYIWMFEKLKPAIDQLMKQSIFRSKNQ